MRPPFARWEAARPDLILLDLGLPDGDGSTVIRRVRRDATTPILVLTRTRHRARQGRCARSRGRRLRDEAVRAGRASRAGRGAAAPGGWPGRRSRPGSCASGRSRSTSRAARSPSTGRRLDLTPREYELLKTMVSQPGRLLTKGRLLRAVWGTAYSYRGALPARVRQPAATQARCGRPDRDGERPHRRRAGRRLPDRRGRASRLERLLSVASRRRAGRASWRPRLRLVSWTARPSPSRPRPAPGVAEHDLAEIDAAIALVASGLAPVASGSWASAHPRPSRRPAWPTRRSQASSSGSIGTEPRPSLTVGPRACTSTVGACTADRRAVARRRRRPPTPGGPPDPGRSTPSRRGSATPATTS